MTMSIRKNGFKSIYVDGPKMELDRERAGHPRDKAVESSILILPG